ncbi:MAG TPA: COX15/CtaA family protein, partial [Candidatus Limnocylindria bacterium]
MTRFAKLAIAAAAATFVLITVGGLVRATDSGLGCPDWPLCFGDWVPPAELHAWIEHSHRLVAAVLVGPLVGAVALITVFTARRRDRALLIAAVGAGVLVIVQAILGGQVVIQQLRRELVTAHLGMALTVLALTILIADRAVHGPMPGRRSALPIGLIGLTTVAVFAQMLLGSWVTGHDAGLAYPDFPLMNGSLLPAVDLPTQAIQVAHRALAVIVAGLVVWTAVVVRRRTQSRLPRALAGVAVGLVIVQVALGAANVWSRLSALFVVPHLAVGAALFATCFWLLLAALREPAVARDPARGATGSAEHATPSAGDTLRAYVALTKPRNIELLL